MFFQESHSHVIKSFIISFFISILLTSCSYSTSSNESTNNEPFPPASPMPVQDTASTAIPSPTSTPSISDTTTSSNKPTPYEEDATMLIEYVESTHPAFRLNDIRPAYYKEKEAYLEACKNNLSSFEFMLLSNKYLTSLADGHTQLCTLLEPEVLSIYQDFISIDDALIMLDKNHHPTKKKIVQMGGETYL